MPSRPPQEPLWNAPRGMTWVRDNDGSPWHLAPDYSRAETVLCGATLQVAYQAFQCGGVSGDPCRLCQAAFWQKVIKELPHA